MVKIDPFPTSLNSQPLHAPVDDAVDLVAELLRDLRLLGLGQLRHDRHDVLPPCLCVFFLKGGNVHLSIHTYAPAAHPSIDLLPLTYTSTSIMSRTGRAGVGHVEVVKCHVLHHLLLLVHLPLGQGHVLLRLLFFWGVVVGVVCVGCVGELFLLCGVGCVGRVGGVGRVCGFVVLLWW